MSLGGEPLRAVWLGQWLGLNAAAATVVISKLAFLAAGLVFVLLAAGALALSGQLSTELAVGLGCFLGAGAALFGAGYWAVRGRKVRYLPALLRRLRLPLRGDAEARWLLIDEALYGFCFSVGRRRQAAVLALHLLERLFHTLEFWILFWLLDLKLGALDALSAYGLTTAANTAFFFVPAGQIGVTEGGQTLALVWLGAAAEDGLALALARRIRSLIWSGFWVLLGRRALSTRSAMPPNA